MTNHSDLLLRLLDEDRSLAPYRWLLRSVGGVIGPSQELQAKSQLLLRGNQRCVYIPNGVDAEFFTPGPAEAEAMQALGANTENRVVLATRRHDPKCGLDLLIRAVPHVIDAHPEALFSLVGDGPQTTTLKNLAHTLGVNQWVRFVGYVPHDQLPRYYRAAYVSVLPSVYEAVSLSGLESLACATPVIGTRVGGIPEFVDEGRTGMLVEPNSPADLARAITWLLDRPDTRDSMATAGRRAVQATFSWDRIAESTVRFYAELLQRQS
jgi:glycosyltransferase involved in cell wall biosynthesis